MPLLLVESFFIAAALSLDAFVACFSYGASGIRLPKLSILILDGISCFVIGITLLLGSLLKNLIPVDITTALCFTILFLLGMIKLLDGIIKSLIRRYGAFSGNLNFHFSSLRLVLSLYANPEDADMDHSKILSPKEALSLALALSLDGCAVGFGTALGNSSGLLVFLCSLFTETLAIVGGTLLGNKTAKKCPFPVSWIGGVFLLLLAFGKLLL